MSEFKQLLHDVLTFRDERDWEQFHTPQHLAAALAIEAAEIQELMLWKDSNEVRAFLADDEKRKRLADEIGDVLIFTLLLGHASGIDVAAAARAKLMKNAQKYPRDLARGRADKYTELQTGEKGG